jgi:capsular exopolysaccharide synthesis family protein
MSRIQNILEKAEREGAVRRIRAVAEPAAIASSPIADSASPPVMSPAPPAPEPQPVVPAVADPLDPSLRIVSGMRLHPILAAAISGTAAEQYRALRTRILHTDNGSAVNVILVTSPGRGEGKSITAANLSLTMAQEYQRRICVVDADLRSPQLQHLFGLPDGAGLSDVLLGHASLDDAIVTVEDHDIAVLPAGHMSVHPAELLGTTMMRRTMDTLRSRFDRVVIDAPAASPLADIGILTPLVDRVLLVVRAGVTSRPAIHDAIAAIDAAKLLGIVLNEAA